MPTDLFSAACLCSVAAVAVLLAMYALRDRGEFARRGIVALSASICLFYIGWRVTAIPVSQGPASLCLGVLLYAAELTGVCSFFAMLYLFSGEYRLERKTLADIEGGLPFVDVLICTYDEPLHLLRMTIAAACNIEYPADRFRVHVCDDGGRAELASMCDEYGAGYISREGSEGAKAGNINNALGLVEGDLFAVLDADMIPKKEFLAETVGYFCNENLAFVQTPQVYYNRDMYQYNLDADIPNEQDFFMREVQQARAARDAVLHVGTNAVFDRRAVIAVGGYPTCSTTEDMALSEKLQGGGYDSLLVNEGLVFGLSATTFPELVKQRDRWCRGNLQVLKRYNPLTLPGLTVSQRIAYADGALYWYGNLSKMVFLVCPLFFLLAGVSVIDAPVPLLLAVFVPYLVGQKLAVSVLTSGSHDSLWSHFYDVAMAPHLAMSVLRETFGMKASFSVTSKEAICDGRVFHWRIVAPHMALLALTAIGWAVSAFHLGRSGLGLQVGLVNYAWSAYNALGLINAIRVAAHRPMHRRTERLAVSRRVPVVVRGDATSAPAAIRDISGEGVSVGFDEGADFSAGDQVVLGLEGADVPCEVVRCCGSLVALRYVEPSPAQMRCLMSVFQDSLRSRSREKAS